jgi:hypothetical protein
MPRPDLAFVIAGGDVLADDHLGHLGLTLDGARRRDLRVVRSLLAVPTVWLPGGGYHGHSWHVLAGTVLALMRHTRRSINPGADPMTTRFTALAKRIGESPARLTGTNDLSFEDVEVELGLRMRGTRALLLNTYTAEGLEYGLYRYGLLGFLERRGYGHFRVALGTASSGGERVSVYGKADGAEHLLGDCVVERRPMSVGEVLYVHWLSLRDPRARFGDRRPRLPGQDVPGLGVAREVTELLLLAAKRLGLGGVAFSPATYHLAAMSRSRFRFVDPVLQGRLEALARDLASMPLATASQAVADGQVLVNGEPYQWEASDMVCLLQGELNDADAVAAERERVRFVVAPPEPPAAS